MTVKNHKTLKSIIVNQNTVATFLHHFLYVITIFKPYLNHNSIMEYKGYEFFSRVTPQKIKGLNLRDAYKKEGQAQLLSSQQLQRVQWQVQLLRKHISFLDQQQENNKLQGNISKLTAENLELEKRIREFDKKVAQRDDTIAQHIQHINDLDERVHQLNQDLEQRDKVVRQTKQVIILSNQTISSLKQKSKSHQRQIAILKEELKDKNHRIAEHIAIKSQNEEKNILQNQRLQVQARTLEQRNQTIIERNQAIANQRSVLNSRLTPFFLKAQFLLGFFIGIIITAVSLALGWKQPDQSGYQKMYAAFIIGVIIAGLWGILTVTAIGKEIYRWYKSEA